MALIKTTYEKTVYPIVGGDIVELVPFSTLDNDFSLVFICTDTAGPIIFKNSDGSTISTVTPTVIGQLIIASVTSGQTEWTVNIQSAAAAADAAYLVTESNSTLTNEVLVPAPATETVSGATHIITGTKDYIYRAPGNTTTTTIQLPSSPTDGQVFTIKNDETTSHTSVDVTSTNGSYLVRVNGNSTATYKLPPTQTLFLRFSSGLNRWMGTTVPNYIQYTNTTTPFTPPFGDYVFLLGAGSSVVNLPLIPGTGVSSLLYSRQVVCYYWNASGGDVTVQPQSPNILVGPSLSSAVSSYTLKNADMAILLSDRNGTWRIVSHTPNIVQANRGGTGLTTSGTDVTKALMSDGSGGFVMATPSGGGGTQNYDLSGIQSVTTNTTLSTSRVIVCEHTADITLTLPALSSNDNAVYLVTHMGTDGAKISFVGDGSDGFHSYAGNDVHLVNYGDTILLIGDQSNSVWIIWGKVLDRGHPAAGFGPYLTTVSGTHTITENTSSLLSALTETTLTLPNPDLWAWNIRPFYVVNLDDSVLDSTLTIDPNGGTINGLSSLYTVYGSGKTILLYHRGSQNWNLIGETPNFENYQEWIWKVWPDTGTNSTMTVGTQTTPTENGTGTVLNDSTGKYVNYASVASNGSVAGWTANGVFTHLQRQWSPVIRISLKTGANSTDIENARIWAGVFSADATASDNPSAHIAAFRYATTTDGTAFWRCVTKDGTTINATTTTYAIASNTRYELEIDMRNSSAILFKINGKIVARHTANLPGATTGLNGQVTVTTTAAATKNLRIAQLKTLYK